MTNTPRPQTPPRQDDPVAALASPIQPLMPRNIETKILLTIALLLCIWGLAIVTFGIPALVWPMKLIVPSLVLALMLLVWGM